MSLPAVGEIKHKYTKLKRHALFFVFLFAAVILLITTSQSTAKMTASYQSRQSGSIADRFDKIISVKLNPLGYYAEYTNAIPDRFRKLVLAQEDQYFYFHPGFNPVSIVRAILRSIRNQPSPASSTITQQLVKILLLQENDRTLKNKLVELWYALSLELHLSKNEILTMYANSVYLGNNVQGIRTASQLYFEKQPDELSDQEWAALINTTRNPVRANPFSSAAKHYSLSLAKKVDAEALPPPEYSPSTIQERKQAFFLRVSSPTGFEINGTDCRQPCRLTVDSKLTENIRSILSRRIERLAEKNVQNGAIVVVKIPENELLAMIGSPDPSANYNGYQINMAVEPRPIGSTIKPFIYLKGFEQGLRPYTLVNDKEYKYIIGSGFAFYPKNFDLAYRGVVSLHYALTNSLNVPTVKVLEYIGLDVFNDFLEEDLEFRPIQPLQSYQLGIALGGLEMDLLHLAQYLTLFPNDGYLRPVKRALSGSEANSSTEKKNC